MFSIVTQGRSSPTPYAVAFDWPDGYRRLGFEALIVHENRPDRWRAVLARLR